MAEARSSKRIPLTQWHFAIVDAEDVEWLSEFRWCVLRTRSGAPRYAVRRENKQFIFMHRMIIPAPNGMDVDHINGNGLDNRRHNLRFCTRSENLQNMRPRGGSSSFKGVYRHKRDQVWRAYIDVNKVRLSLGSFQDETDAARAYDEAARKHFGAFARPNFLQLHPETSTEE
ncbi:Pathogenesis-related transcriptional factor and ERF protein [Rhodospirillaceae bacterium LM-1]|nr:Pathogenesis-related transcriptional factor and ERF protein [Rhodospirillaceae bacterium LM-1]